MPRPRPDTPCVRALTAAALAAITTGAAAQSQPQQVVRGPIATSWMTADTTSGLGAMMGGGVSGMFGMMMGRGPQGPMRTLDLRLGSSQAPSGAPQAEHLIPSTMHMGPSLPLVTPQPGQSVTRSTEPEEQRQLPEGVERPKGRMLIFWGCGPQVGPGQPIVIDFSNLGAGAPMPRIASREVRVPRGPSYGASRGYGEWPNERDRQAVPVQASLRGEHQVRGTYSPDIRFTVDRHDFMGALEIQQARTGAATRLSWAPVDRATGYFLSAIGGREGRDGGSDLVLWTSSAVQDMGGALVGHVPPGEVARLIREKVVLAPAITECTVPAEVVQAMPAGMLTGVAYGEELNLVHPPRPQDPKVAWEQQWAVKLRLRSTTMLPLGEGMGASGRRGGTAPAAGGAPPVGDPAPAGNPSAEGAPPQSPASPVGGAAGAVEQGVREGINTLRNLFGR
jgi:hypothetical protein